MNGSDAIYITLATLNGLMAVMLLRYLPRFGREMPWLGLLSIYFGTRAYRRILSMLDGRVAESRLDLFIDVLVAGVLIGLVFSTDKMIRGFAASRDQAAYRAEEYERARRHYTQVVRHRILNPLTVIRGSAVTIKAGIGDDDTRGQLCDAIREATEQIEAVSLEPEREGVEEHELDAVPRPNV